MKKKIMLSLAAVAMVGTLAVGGTLAWFTDTETATNVVTTGNVDVKITETLDTDHADENKYTAVNNNGEGITYSGIEPGTTIHKDPVITYEGQSNAYVRYKVVVTTIDRISGAVVELPEGVKFMKGTEDVTTDVKAGNYVYDYEIYSPTKTAVAAPFDKIEFPSTLGNKIADKEINIEIVAQALQADNLVEGNNPTHDQIEKAFEGTFVEGADLGYDNDIAVEETTASQEVTE